MEQDVQLDSYFKKNTRKTLRWRSQVQLAPYSLQMKNTGCFLSFFPSL